MALNQAAGLQGMLKGGHQHYEGVDEAVAKNIDAVKQLAQKMSTSLGPNGMNKLVVNHLEKIIVTSDCATMVRELEVVHPAAKMVALASDMQEQECGDGTNFVVTFAGELLSKALDLLRSGVHISEVVEGYERAFQFCLDQMPQLVCHEVRNSRDMDCLVEAIRPVVAAKQHGNEDHLSELVAEACLTTMGRSGKFKSDSVRICKMMGGRVRDSEIIRGMVLQRRAEGAITRAENAKISIYACGLEASMTEAKSTVLLRNADDLLSYTRSEERKMEDVIKAIAETGTKVIVCNGTISDMAMHYIEKYKIMALKVHSKWELRRLCGTCNATAMVRLGPATPEELGYCDMVEMREIGGRQVCVFNQSREETRVCTIVLRSSTAPMLNDLERAVDDGVNCVKILCRDPSMLCGGGAFEMEMASRVQAFGDEQTGLDQYAIKKYGESFEAVPRILARNSGQDMTQIISQLYAAHAGGDMYAGVNIDEEAGICDMHQKRVFDLLYTKMQALRLATDAATTVLRVDQIIMAKQAGGPKAPPQAGHDA